MTNFGARRSAPPGRTLLVAAAGGHVAELLELRTRLVGVEERPLWMVPDNEQSRDLLHGEDVVHAPSVRPRDLRNLGAATLMAQRFLARESVGSVVSTGSAIAVAVFLPARSRRIPCHYIESAARVEGPSLTGRLVQMLPGVHLYRQHAWHRPGRWQLCSSVFDGFEWVSRERAPGPLRVVVTVGTMSFGFRRLLDQLVEIMPRDAEVVWQTGATDTHGLRIEHRPWVGAADLQAYIQRADAVVAHAGVGSALSALQAGAFPILVPRRSEHGEHVDDHQVQIARALSVRRLARAAEPNEITAAMLHDAAAQGVRRRTVGVEPIPLRGHGAVLSEPSGRTDEPTDQEQSR